MADPVRVFIGGTAEHDLPTAVLTHSILKHARRDVEIRLLTDTGINVPVPKDPHNRQVTSFSFQRFLIPEAINFEGRGIYLDSDMVVFRDIGELWDCPFPNGSLVQMCPGWQSAVMLIDGRCGWKISELVQRLDRGELTYRNMVNVKALGHSTDSLPALWNCMDHMPEGCRLLHFTHMSSQPWLNSKHELGRVWEAALVDAMKDGAVSPEMVRDAIRLQFARPSLAILMEEEPPYEDVHFVPPHLRRKLGSAA